MIHNVPIHKRHFGTQYLVMCQIVELTKFISYTRGVQSASPGASSLDLQVMTDYLPSLPCESHRLLMMLLTSVSCLMYLIMCLFVCELMLWICGRSFTSTRDHGLIKVSFYPFHCSRGFDIAMWECLSTFVVIGICGMLYCCRFVFPMFFVSTTRVFYEKSKFAVLKR